MQNSTTTDGQTVFNTDEMARHDARMEDVEELNWFLAKVKGTASKTENALDVCRLTDRAMELLDRRAGFRSEALKAKDRACGHYEAA